VVSQERAHAAAVQQSEEEALRRVRERQKTERRDASKGGGDQQARTQLREAKRAVERAEGEVARCEGDVGRLSGTLESPDLYTKPDGAKRARELGQELEKAKRALDRALAQWGEATEKLEKMERTTV
jgi:hypothetical protein